MREMRKFKERSVRACKAGLGNNKYFGALGSLTRPTSVPDLSRFNPRSLRRRAPAAPTSKSAIESTHQRKGRSWKNWSGATNKKQPGAAATISDHQDVHKTSSIVSLTLLDAIGKHKLMGFVCQVALSTLSEALSRLGGAPVSMEGPSYVHPRTV